MTLDETYLQHNITECEQELEQIQKAYQEAMLVAQSARERGLQLEGKLSAWKAMLDFLQEEEKEVTG